MKNVKYLKFLMIPVILLALVLPQFLFSAQDRYMMKKTFSGKREGVDPTILNLKFVEGTFYDKLSWLAKGFSDSHEMQLLEVEGELAQEKQKEYLENVFDLDRTGDWTFWIVRYTYYMYETFFDNPGGLFLYAVEEKNRMKIEFSPDVYRKMSDWKKYILVDEQEMGAMELWYGNVQLAQRPDIYMQILADAEDGYIYYVQFQKKSFPEGFSQNDLEKVTKNGYPPVLFSEYIDGEVIDEYLTTLYYPKDYAAEELRGNSIRTILNYQRWTGEVDSLHSEYFVEIGTDEQYFLRIGIIELRELFSDMTAP